MERLTVRCDFGLEEEVEQIGYNLPNVEERGFYSIYDLAKYAEDDVVLKEMLGRISLKLAEYEDTGLTPEEIESFKENYEMSRTGVQNLSAKLVKLDEERKYWRNEALKWALKKASWENRKG